MSDSECFDKIVCFFVLFPRSRYTDQRVIRVFIVPGACISFLLLLDELGYLLIDKREADLLFAVVSARNEVRSIVITTNRSIRDWGRLFDVDNILSTALIDRLAIRAKASSRLTTAVLAALGRRFCID